MRRGLISGLSALAAVGLLGIAVPSATAATTVPRGTFTTYTLPTPSTSLGGITRGADGAMWFTEPFLHRLGRISGTGGFAEYPIIGAVSGDPHRLVSGPDGRLWFTLPGAGYIGRFDLHTHAVSLFPVGDPTQNTPWDITVGPDRNLWFTETSVHSIGRVTPNGVVTLFRTGLSGGDVPWMITTGPDHNLWFTDQGTTHGVGRVTTTGAIRVFRTGVTALGDGIVGGPDGNVWLTETAVNKVARVTPAGAVKEITVPSVVPKGIVVGPDRALWITEALTFNGTKVGMLRLTTGGVATQYKLARQQPPLIDAAVGPDGSLWVIGDHIEIEKVTTGVPTPPRALTVTYPAAGRARVAWVPPASPGMAALLRYEVRWSGNNGASWTAFTSTLLHPAAGRMGLTKGHRYLVQVRAVNVAGASLVAQLAFTQAK